jgi:hypothetical protein
VLIADGALEGEDLRVVACPSGTHEVQDVCSSRTRFSRDRLLCWRDGKVGDALVLAVPVPAAGRYKVSAAFVPADDCGIVQVSLGGHALGAPSTATRSARAAPAHATRPPSTLPAGDAELRFPVDGKNEHAKPRFLLGLDYVRLQRQQ